MLHLTPLEQKLVQCIVRFIAWSIFWSTVWSMCLIDCSAHSLVHCLDHCLIDGQFYVFYGALYDSNCGPILISNVTTDCSITCKKLVRFDIFDGIFIDSKAQISLKLSRNWQIEFTRKICKCSYFSYGYFANQNWLKFKAPSLL